MIEKLEEETREQKKIGVNLAVTGMQINTKNEEVVKETIQTVIDKKK